jgi:hypothetical protein
MRIVSVRLEPAARVFALTYAVAGLASSAAFAFSGLPRVLLPIGIVMGPLFYLNFNIILARSPDLIANAFLCLGVIFSYAVTGWITGLAITLCFNLIAKKTGGINAKFVTMGTDDSVIAPLA